MAWIESHQTLRDHPKVRKAARVLDVGIPQLIGHLHCLWHQALDLALDGDLTRWDTDDIAHAAMWDGDPDRFVDALVGCGFADGPGFLEYESDGHLVIHDWEHHTRHLRSRQQASVKANHTRWHVNKGVVADDCDLCTGDRTDPPPTEPDSDRNPNGPPNGSPRTPPDRTRPDQTGEHPSAADATPHSNQQPAASSVAELWQPVITACRMEHPRPGTRARKTLLAALEDLTRNGATPDQVPRRADAYRRKWPDADLTPPALAKHWPQLAPDRPPQSRTDPERHAAINRAAQLRAAGMDDDAARELATVGLDLTAIGTSA